jgi:hypothetical protein
MKSAQSERSGDAAAVVGHLQIRDNSGDSPAESLVGRFASG